MDIQTKVRACCNPPHNAGNRQNIEQPKKATPLCCKMRELPATTQADEKIDQPISSIRDDHREKKSKKNQHPSRGIFVCGRRSIVNLHQILPNFPNPPILHAGWNLIALLDLDLLAFHRKFAKKR